MWASFFAHDNNQPNHYNIIKDVIRLVRDALAIANDFMQLSFLTTIVDYLNHLLGDTQSNTLEMNP